MPLFTTLSALSQTPASNPPDGSVDLPSTIDDQMRLLASFIAQLRDGSGFTSGALAPSGTVFDYAGTSVPSGYLACDGSAVSRTTYSALFTAIGTTWGVGDGSTTFNVPDLRGRTSIGSGTGSGLTARTLGTQNIGEETHVLTAAENGPHTHAAGAITITDPGHATGINNTPHNHRLLVSDGAGGIKAPGDPAANGLLTGAGTGSSYVTNPGALGSPLVEATTTAITANAAFTGITASGAATASSGSGTAHNNMQPSAVVNKIIKT